MAADLASRFDGAARTYKIDVFELQPEGPAAAVLEQWTAVITCAPDGPREEACSFRGGVWWGAVKRGAESFHAVALPDPGTLHLRWTERGRLRSWELRGGDEERFFRQASNARLQTLQRANSTYGKHDQRRVGEAIREDLARSVAGALEWELPEALDSADAARTKHAPWRARQWRQSTVKARVDLDVTERGDTQVTIALRGDVSERSGATGQLTRGTLTGGVRFDPVRRRVVEGWTEVARRTMEGRAFGYARMRTYIVAWKPGDSSEPADLPSTREVPPSFSLPARLP